MHGPSKLTLIPIIQIIEFAYSWISIKHTRNSRQILENIVGIHTISLVPEMLTDPGCWKKYQMNAMAKFYDPNIWYKTDLTFYFMNFNENFINRNEKVEKLNG